MRIKKREKIEEKVSFSLLAILSFFCIFLIFFMPTARSWEDLGTQVNCSNCADCTAAIGNASAGDTVTLNMSLLNVVGTCINFSRVNNATFDCKGYEIQGDDDASYDYGVYMNNSQNNTVKNCNISSFFNGVYSFYSKNLTLINITTSNNVQNGMYIYYSNDSLFVNLTSNSNTWEGIIMGWVNRSTITNLVANKSKYGLRLVVSSNNTFRNTVVNNNSDYGIYLQNSMDNNFTGVIAYNNSIAGIYLGASSSNNITNFTSLNNPIGITLVTGSNGNVFTNIFIRYGATGISFGYSNNNTLNNVTVFNTTSGTGGGIYITICNWSRLSNIVSNNNSGNGIEFQYSNNTFLTNITTNYNYQYGIYSYTSSYINLTNVVSSYNFDSGIILSTVREAVLFNVTTDYNGRGISADSGIDLSPCIGCNMSAISSNNNTKYGVQFTSSTNDFAAGIVASNNSQIGVYISGSSSVNLSDTVAQNNRLYDVGIAATSASLCDNSLSNVIGTGGYPIEHYNQTAVIQNKTLSGLILCNADNSFVSNITIVSSADVRNNGIQIYLTDNTSFYDINSSFAYKGIYLYTSNNNTLSTLITNNNSNHGVDLYSSNNNTFTNITTKYNDISGICFERISGNNTLNDSFIMYNLVSGINFTRITYNPQYNLIYNNYFNNTRNYYNSTSIINYLNTSKTLVTNIINGNYIGGNFWATPEATGFSETCTTDANSDGICDIVYNLSSVTSDYLPLIVGSGSPEAPPSDEPSDGGDGSTSGTVSFASPGNPLEISITNPGIDVTNVMISVFSTVYNPSVTIMKIDPPIGDLQIGLPSGQVYQAFEIETNIKRTDIANVVVDFKVNKTWLEQINGATEKIRLYKKQDNATQWEALETSFIKEEGGYYYFSSAFSELSSFLIFFGEYECQVGTKRCFESQSQLCLGNATWLITEKCVFGCDNGECLKIPPLPVMAYTIVIAVVSIAIILTIYFILRRIRRKR